ncbi:MAG: hypothetical protein P8X90_25370 [Desulfobacterales bacterium]|jgi:hypothetical protein
MSKIGIALLKNLAMNGVDHVDHPWLDTKDASCHNARPKKPYSATLNNADTPLRLNKNILRNCDQNPFS